MTIKKEADKLNLTLSEEEFNCIVALTECTKISNYKECLRCYNIDYNKHIKMFESLFENSTI